MTGRQGGGTGGQLKYVLPSLSPRAGCLQRPLIEKQHSNSPPPVKVIEGPGRVGSGRVGMGVGVMLPTSRKRRPVQTDAILRKEISRGGVPGDDPMTPASLRGGGAHNQVMTPAPLP